MVSPRYPREHSAKCSCSVSRAGRQQCSRSLRSEACLFDSSDFPITSAALKQKSQPKLPQNQRLVTYAETMLDARHARSRSHAASLFVKDAGHLTAVGGSEARCPRARARHLCSRAAWASSCRHYDRRARCSLDWDRYGAGNTRGDARGLRPPVGAAFRIKRSVRVSGSMA
jgi:hypothetical protein